MTATDADRAKAAEIVLDGDGTFGDWERLIAAALAEARAPYDRLTADLWALAEELERADELVDVAARLRAVVAAATEGAIR